MRATPALLLLLAACQAASDASTGDATLGDAAVLDDAQELADVADPPADTGDDSPDEAEPGDAEADDGGDAVADASGDDTGDGDTTTDAWPELVYADAQLALAADFVPDYPGVGDGVVTTLVETLRAPRGFVPHVDADGALLAPVGEIGHLVAQPGEPHLLRDQLALPEGMTLTLSDGKLPDGARSELWAFVMADPQLVDQDSPVQVAKNAAHQLEGIPLPAYTPQGELAPMVNDALVRSANRFQDRPFDVVIIAGDHVENSQRNELSWLHGVLNGGVVSSDSGAADDPVPGPDNDAYDPFVAQGFLPGTPWISTVGNHDVNVNGNFPPGLVQALNADAEIRAQLDSLSSALGLAFPYDPLDDATPALFPPALRSAFRVLPEGFHPGMFTSDAELDTLVPGPTPADPQRAALGPCGFITDTYAAGGAPAGHGFTAENAADCTGFYVYEPIPGAPVRIISLDLGPAEGGSDGILAPPYADGAPDLTKVGDPRWDQVAFLDAELARAAEDGVAVIVISHQASDGLATHSLLQEFASLVKPFPELYALLMAWSPLPPVAVDGVSLREKLAASPNVVAHIAGHNHANRVRAICPDGSSLDADEGRCAPGPNGEAGYWELTTAAGIDFPHQGRFVELAWVSGRLGALVATMLDPRIPAGSFAERGRFVSTAWEELRDGGAHRIGALSDRNLVLPFVLPEAVAQRWATAGATTLESQTTLLETKAPLPALPVWP